MEENRVLSKNEIKEISNRLLIISRHLDRFSAYIDDVEDKDSFEVREFESRVIKYFIKEELYQMFSSI